jgi:energy-converting hydrogenase Eha subunit B
MVALKIALSVPMKPCARQWPTLKHRNQDKGNQVTQVQCDGNICCYPEAPVGKDAKVEAADRNFG